MTRKETRAQIILDIATRFFGILLTLAMIPLAIMTVIAFDLVITVNESRAWKRFVWRRA